MLKGILTLLLSTGLAPHTTIWLLRCAFMVSLVIAILVIPMKVGWWVMLLLLLWLTAWVFADRG
ncbi:hypothetical protein PUR29_35135 [Methylobacterium ajmalii]|uniref:Uncharacterized protein n=1 Tax=Methylobacterium ajmalii TaxID=2738439 RepID=A0ABV0A626_9HYPH